MHQIYRLDIIQELAFGKPEISCQLQRSVIARRPLPQRLGGVGASCLSHVCVCTQGGPLPPCSRWKRSMHAHRFACSRIDPGADTAGRASRFPCAYLLEPGYLIPVYSREYAVSKETNWPYLTTLLVPHDVIAVQAAIPNIWTKHALPHLLFQVLPAEDSSRRAACAPTGEPEDRPP